MLAGLIHHWPEVKETMKWQEYREDSYHMNFSAMKTILGKFSWIYSFNVLAAMRNLLARCRSCNSDRKMKELEKPRIIFLEAEMDKFRAEQ